MFRLNAGQPRHAITSTGGFANNLLFPLLAKDLFQLQKYFLVFLDLGSKTTPFLALIYKEAK